METLEHHGESMEQPANPGPQPELPIQHWQRIHLNRHRADAGVEQRARPHPVGRFLHQSAPHGIVVNVLDHLQQGRWFEGISIVTAAALPETIVDFAAGLRVLQFLQVRWRALLEELQGLLRHRQLQGGANLANLVLRFARPEEHMDVFGHDHVGPEVEVEFAACSAHGVDEPLARAVFGEESQTVKAREGQLMGMARLVVAADLLVFRGHGWRWLGDDVAWLFHAFAVVLQGFQFWRGIGESMPPRWSVGIILWLFHVNSDDRAQHEPTINLGGMLSALPRHTEEAGSTRRKHDPASYLEAHSILVTVRYCGTTFAGYSMLSPWCSRASMFGEGSAKACHPDSSMGSHLAAPFRFHNQRPIICLR